MALSQTVHYTFSSGFQGDGFDWPDSPTGLLDEEWFLTPDDVEIANYIGNNLFFDSQYQVIGNASGISSDAMWGNPTFDGYGDVDIYFWGFEPPQTVSFDFAWSASGSPDATPEFVDVYLEDSEGRSTVVTEYLGETFTGFGGFDGYADHLYFDAAELTDEFGGFDGGTFVDIYYLYIYVDEIATGGPAGEFGIDNLITNGSVSNGELFPSVNGGSIDVTGSILSNSVLRGTGTHGIGLEVTNGTNSDTTYSTELLPGSELADAGQINNAFIAAGQTIYTPDLVTVDRSQPTGVYDADIRVINEGDPLDPDNEVTLRGRIVDPPLLSAPSPVDVTAGEPVELANAAAATNGYRASVEITGTTVDGPFEVSGFATGTPVKPEEMLSGTAVFDRFGKLSGGYDGTFTASLEMTFFVGINNDIEVVLNGTEPVPDAHWILNATLTDTLNDQAAYTNSQPLGPGLIGVNSDTTAGTLLAGEAAVGGNVSLALATAAQGSATGIIGQQVTTDFSSGVPVHVVQVTYNDASLCAGMTEADQRLLFWEDGSSDWDLAVNGNSDGGAGATFFTGSFQDFADTLGGASLSTALGTHGLDSANSQVWAVVDHEAVFGTGQLGRTCDNAADFDDDGDVDADDLDLFRACAAGPAVTLAPACDAMDLDGDNDADMIDFAIFQRSLTAP